MNPLEKPYAWGVKYLEKRGGKIDRWNCFFVKVWFIKELRILRIVLNGGRRSGQEKRSSGTG